MRKILIWMISLYQKIPGSFHNNCIFQPTCSEYTISAIKKYGCLKGIYMSLKRLLRCRPGGAGGYDPVK